LRSDPHGIAEQTRRLNGGVGASTPFRCATGLRHVPLFPVLVPKLLGSQVPADPLIELPSGLGHASPELATASESDVSDTTRLAGACWTRSPNVPLLPVLSSNS